MVQGYEKVPCKHCGRPTFMTGTRRCDYCWELEHRARSNPQVAAAIVLQFKPTLFIAVRNHSDGMKYLGVCADGVFAQNLCSNDWKRHQMHQGRNLIWRECFEGDVLSWEAVAYNEGLYEVQPVTGMTTEA